MNYHVYNLVSFRSAFRTRCTFGLLMEMEGMSDAAAERRQDKRTAETARN